MLIISEFVGLRAKPYANELWDVESSEYHDEKNPKVSPNVTCRNASILMTKKTVFSTRTKNRNSRLQP